MASFINKIKEGAISGLFSYINKIWIKKAASKLKEGKIKIKKGTSIPVSNRKRPKKVELKYSIIKLHTLQNEEMILQIYPEILGEGGYGKIKVAWDLASEQLVALKIEKNDQALEVERQNIVLEIEENEKALGIEKSAFEISRIKSELEEQKAYAKFMIAKKCHALDEQMILAKMDRLLGVAEQNNKCYTAMVLYPGSSLSRKFFCRLPLEDRIFWATQMIRELESLHGQEILHRDLKPRNMLLLEDDRQIKIIDFGLSTLLEGQEYKEGGWVGSKNYVAPEIKRGTELSRYSAKSDIWSLGKVLKEKIFAGPFLEKIGSFSEVILQWYFQKDQKPLRNWLQLKQINLLLDKMMAGEPNDRPSLSECDKKLQMVQASLKQESENKSMLDIFKLTIASTFLPLAHSRLLSGLVQFRSKPVENKPGVLRVP